MQRIPALRTYNANTNSLQRVRIVNMHAVDVDTRIPILYNVYQFLTMYVYVCQFFTTCMHIINVDHVYQFLVMER